MFELLLTFLVVVVISAVAGAVAAFTHYALLSNLLTTVHADIAKLEAKAAEVKKAL